MSLLASCKVIYNNLCRCIVTTSFYTKDEDFTTADAVFDCLGEAGEERVSLHDLTTPGMKKLNQMAINMIPFLRPK